MEIHQHYQTCKDIECLLFDMCELSCSALKAGNCKYQTIHMLQDAYNQYLDGKKHGLHKDWYDNGQLWAEDHYVNGELHGKYRYWYESGQLESESNYVNGNVHGIWRNWHENGQLMYEGNCKDGDYHGLWRYWRDDGQLQSERTYVNGKSV